MFQTIYCAKHVVWRISLFFFLFLLLIMASSTVIGTTLVLRLTPKAIKSLESRLDTESFLILALRKQLNTSDKSETAEKSTLITFGPVKWRDHV